MENFISAIIIGIVEGLTEFLPISSTGHMIIAGHMLGFTGPKAHSFEIFIQLGAILSVVFLYREKFWGLLRPILIPTSQIQSYDEPVKGFVGWNGVLLLFLTTLPALIAGKLAHGYIKENLFSTTTVALGLGLGGIAIVVVENFIPRTAKRGLDAITWRDALIIGCFQCLALWPGVSRSASTIIGGMLYGIERKTIAEYSFLAAVPLMCAATSYDLFKSRAHLELSDAWLFLVGFIVSFFAAWMAIRLFISFLGKYTLKGFGWYRMVLAVFTIWFFGW